MNHIKRPYFAHNTREFYKPEDGSKSLRQIGAEAAKLYDSALGQQERVLNDTRGTYLDSEINELQAAHDSLTKRVEKWPLLKVVSFPKLRRIDARLQEVSQWREDYRTVVAKAIAERDSWEDPGVAHFEQYASEYHDIAVIDAYEDGIQIKTQQPLILGTPEASQSTDY